MNPLSLLSTQLIFSKNTSSNEDTSTQDSPDGSSQENESSQSKSPKSNKPSKGSHSSKNASSNQDSNKSSKSNSSKSPNPKMPLGKKKLILNILTIIFVILAFVAVLTLTDQIDQQESNQQKHEFSQLITQIRQDKVSRIIVSEDNSQLKVDIYQDPQNPDRDNTKTKTYRNPAATRDTSALEVIKNALGEDSDFQVGTDKGAVIYEEEPKSWFTKLLESDSLWYIFLLLVFLGFGILFIRKIADSNSKAISFGNSKAKVFDELDAKDKVTFKDVAGNEEAKQELSETVDFLKRPEAYQAMGAEIPKGALLVGQPGNGKTLMAKAVAGEAKAPFFYVSGSEFVEMFVGVGAGRVRDLFKRAKKKAPCVIFIDEMDAVGRQRGAGMGGGNDEREQTLNQILVEMDGFEPNESVIVIGATNRPDVLDPALLRPGRFDRQVTVTAPDRQERKKILEVHSKGKKLADNIDLDIIAKRTPGFSGADLSNVLNEAAILSVREHHKEISNETLREAIEKVALGPTLRSKIITSKQKTLTAYHESGHALTATVLPKAQKVQKVTIIPRGKAAGYTFNTEKENDPMTKTKSEFMDEIAVLFGGYVVEEQIFQDISTGASNDLQKATEMARDMVKKYGMSDLGPISYDDGRGTTFLGRDLTADQKHYSEEMAGRIDEEIKKILNQGYRRCREVITQYQHYLDALAQALLEKEVLEYEEFNTIVQDIMVEDKTVIDPKEVTISRDNQNQPQEL